MLVRYKYTRAYRDRHGKLRFEYRRNGKTRRLRGTPGTPEFQAAYDAAHVDCEMATHAEDDSITRAPPGTLRWLCCEYFKSTEFGELDLSTQRVRRLVLESICREPWTKCSSRVFGDAPIRAMTPQALMVLRDRKLGLPEAARARLKAISRVFDWALEAQIPAIERNPARDVRYPKPNASGIHSWTVTEVGRFEAHHPIGSKARLALALLLFTGQRRSDVILFGPQHVRDGSLTFTQQKNKGRRPVTLTLPLLPVLHDIIASTTIGLTTFLVTDFGKSFSRAGFGNKFREWCDEAGLKHCTAHGLRKAGAVIAAENGATAHQLKSIFGWSTLKQAELYTRGAEQKRLAEDAMGLLQVRKGSR
jgi:integrase